MNQTKRLARKLHQSTVARVFQGASSVALLRASCPSPYGPAKLYKSAPGGFVVTEERAGVLDQYVEHSDRAKAAEGVPWGSRSRWTGAIFGLATGAAAALLMGLTAAPLYAQMPEHLRGYALARPQDSGDIVAPMFNGWFKNDDGSVTYMFGFANRNREQIVDIPIGPNNRLEPTEFDGVQPTHFPVYARRGFVGIQERGAFAVTVPADQAGTEVVWHLTHAGHTYSIPGRATSTAYELSREPAAVGSLRPAIRFDMDGPESTDSQGIYAARVTAEVGKPVTLVAYAQDRGEREGYDVESLTFPVGSEWILHQGPAIPDFEPEKITGSERGENGEGSLADGWSLVQTQATFWEPGEYVVRLRVDNFEAPDSQFDNVCCWANAYVPVTVTP